MPPGCGGAGAPEKRVKARSKRPRRSAPGCTCRGSGRGSSLNTRSACEERRQKRRRRRGRSGWSGPRERDRPRPSRRHRPDLRPRCPARAAAQRSAVEVRHGRRASGSERVTPSLVREHQRWSRKSNSTSNARSPARHGGGRQPPRRDVQDHVPPVVLDRRQRQPRLADDLGPHVQAAVGVAPGRERQRRPGFLARAHRILYAAGSRRSRRVQSTSSRSSLPTNSRVFSSTSRPSASNFSCAR